MTELEKVIKGMEACIKGDCRENACPYALDNVCRKSLAIDAISLLKAQKPRVMTLEEVEALPYGHVLIETDKNESLRWLDALMFCKNTNFSFDFITLEGRARLLGTEYNREWRCWTSRPTDEQREAVKWDE